MQSIVSGKLALKYTGPDIEAMKSIAQASHKRSLADFNEVRFYFDYEITSSADSVYYNTKVN